MKLQKMKQSPFGYRDFLCSVLCLPPLVFLILLQGGCSDAATNNEASLKWFKGNLHTHTNLNHGDAPPDEVIDWYLEHDYDFVVITDHNLRLDNPGFREKKNKKILVLAGEEVSIAKNRVHIGAIHIQQVIPEEMAALTAVQESLLKTQLQEKGKSDKEIESIMPFMGVFAQFKAVTQAIERQGGIAVFNHPAMSVDPALFEKLSEIHFFELWNPRQDNRFGAPNPEDMWDKALTLGRKLYAVSGDDAHQFRSVRGTHPGTTWVWVRAAELNPEALVSAMKQGDFYISTGIKLKRVDFLRAKKKIVIEVDSEKSEKYTIQFVGKNGTLLKEVTSDQAHYDYKGDELYVRVKILDQEGRKAYTQAFVISPEH